MRRLWPRCWTRLPPAWRPVVLLAIGAVLLASRPVLDGDTSPYIHVRWRSDVSTAERWWLEWRFALRPQQGDGRSFGYDLLDPSAANVAALIGHPAVEDTASLDRARGSVSPDAETGDSRTGLAWRLRAEALLPWLRLAAWLLVLSGSVVWLDLVMPAGLFGAGVTTGATAAGDRFLELDMLRGVAAMAVVLFHLTSRFGDIFGFPGTPVLTVPLGFYGVHLFFVIGGMVIFLTIERSRSALDFVLARAGRLLPAYWGAVTLTFLVVSAAGLPGVVLTTRDYAWNLTMLQRFVAVQDVDGVYWTLQVELVFYVAMLGVLAFRSIHRIGAILLVWLAALTIDGGSGFLAHEGLESSRVQLVSLYGYAPLFIAGIVLHLRRVRGRWTWGPACLLAWALAVFAWRSPVEATTVVVGVVATVDLAIRGHLRRLAVSPLVWLGMVSYPLYLVHQHVGYVVLRAAYARGVPTHAGLALAAGVVLVLAVALHRLIERPCRRRIRVWRARLAAMAADG